MKTKTSIAMAVVVAAGATSAFAERGNVSMFDLRSSVSSTNNSPRGVSYYDNLEWAAGMLGSPVDGTVNPDGGAWGSFDATFEPGTTGVAVNQVNTFADDFFFTEVLTQIPGGFNAADTFVMSTDIGLSSLNTARFMTPTSLENTFFTRVGDSDGGGTFDVLQIDPASMGTGTPAGIFIDTGVPIPTLTQFTLSIAVNGTSLEVLLNGSSIFSGSVLGSPLDGLPYAENLTGSQYESGNDSTGFGDIAQYDNVSVVVPAPASLALLGLGGLAIRRRR